MFCRNIQFFQNIADDTAFRFFKVVEGGGEIVLTDAFLPERRLDTLDQTGLVFADGIKLPVEVDDFLQFPHGGDIAFQGGIVHGNKETRQKIASAGNAAIRTVEDPPRRENPPKKEVNPNE